MTRKALAPKPCAAMTYSEDRKGQDLPTHHAGVIDPVGDAQYNDDIDQASADDGQDGQIKQHAGQRQLYVAEPHYDVIQNASPITGDQPECHAQETPDGDCAQADQQRNTRAVDNTRPDVAPQTVSA